VEEGVADETLAPEVDAATLAVSARTR
jgi:hypothetical protein